MNAAVKLLVVRHSTYGREDRCLGRSDPPCAQSATVIAGRLNALSWEPAPALVWSSPLRRCVEAARLLTSHLRAQLIVDERLLDADMGSWTGQPWGAIARSADGGLARWVQQEPAEHGGESARALEIRVRRWWDGLDNRTCHALVGHDLVVAALDVVVRNRSWMDALSTPLVPEGIDRFE